MWVFFYKNTICHEFIEILTLWDQSTYQTVPAVVLRMPFTPSFLLGNTKSEILPSKFSIWGEFCKILKSCCRFSTADKSYQYRLLLKLVIDMRWLTIFYLKIPSWITKFTYPIRDPPLLSSILKEPFLVPIIANGILSSEDVSLISMKSKLVKWRSITAPVFFMMISWY